MTKNCWAPLLRLQEQYRAASDQSTRDTLEAAMTREVNAITAGLVTVGTLDTMRQNLRLRARRRARIERLYAPLMRGANDPWPELDRRMQLDRTIAEQTPRTRATLELIVSGLTYAEAANAMDEPEGTLKSRVSRAIRAGR